MIVIKISDGLGNQMFQYACGYAVATRLGQKLKLYTSILDDNPIRKYELNQYSLKYYKLVSFKNIPFKFVRQVLRKLIEMKYKLFMNYFKDENAYRYNSNIEKLSGNQYISGYWQSEKYFSAYREDILKMFKPKQISSETKYIESLLNNQNSVSVHVRRGDYLKVGYSLNMDYYAKAIKKILNTIDNPIFYIFSDDISYCKEFFSKYKDIHIIYPEVDMDNPIIEDMYLMSCCRHNIVANSSYSWWGAWLNQNPDKIVVCPEFDMWTGDFYPENWIKIQI